MQTLARKCAEKQKARRFAAGVPFQSDGIRSGQRAPRAGMMAMMMPGCGGGCHKTPV